MDNSEIGEFIDFVIENYKYQFSMNKYELREFITDFIYSVNNSKDFEISVKDVAKWLRVNEKKLKETVYRSYKKNIDYKTDRQYTAGRPRIDLYLSNDCFKSLCLRSNSKRGEVVRQYFILIENVYREFMTQSINNRQRIDEEDYSAKNYRQTKYPIGNCVYIIRVLYKNISSYRIGKTNDLNRRLDEHRRTFAGKVKLILYDLYEHNYFLENIPLINSEENFCEYSLPK